MNVLRLITRHFFKVDIPTFRILKCAIYGQFQQLISIKKSVVKIDFFELIITSLHLVIKLIIHFLDDGTDQRIHINTKSTLH